MTVRINNKKYKLPVQSDGFGKAESKFWYDKIIPLAKDTTNFPKDLRFYDRRDLGLS